MAVTVDQVHVARQPILDARQQVFGYEPLYRATAAADACLETSASVSARVIGDALLGIGFEPSPTAAAPSSTSTCTRCSPMPAAC
jgi:c-di-GMP-related signal transduction protein